MLDEKRDGNQDSSVPLTNLGRVIERRKKLNIPQEEVAKVCSLTKQRWNQIEKAYQDDACADRVFSFGEMHKLNLLLSFDENEALSTKREPAVFSEREIIERSFYDAMERDSFLTSLVLRRICESSEEDLTLLQQTASVLVDGGIPYKYDSLLVFYAAMRKHIMRAICQIVPDEEALDSFVSSVKKTMEEESISTLKGKAERAEEVVTQKDMSEREDDLNQNIASADKVSEAEDTDIRKEILLSRYAIEKIIDSLMPVIKNEVRIVFEREISQKVVNFHKND